MSEIINEQDLNEVFEEEMDDSDVITVPIDSTLTRPGEAADAKAVGDALAMKANLADIVGVSVNGEEADNQGLILIDGGDIPLSDADGAPTIAEAVESALTTLEGLNAAEIPMSSAEGADSVAEAITELQEGAAGCVKSVNGEYPDENGGVQVNMVPFAQNLTSDTAQASAGTFTLRTTGGSRSVKSGSAQIQEIRGAMIHTGAVQEVLEWEVTGDDITAEVDRAEWIAAVNAEGTYEFTYDGSVWRLGGSTVTLGDYGITIDGTPANGNTITVNYVPEDRGVITPATPEKFIATGWNLFNASAGYARVKKYEYKYHIGGDYTGLQYSATLNGTRSAVTVEENGSFDVPGDGYVWPADASAANTYITTEWTDWTGGPGGTFESYSENEIDLTDVMGSVFPDGLLAVGTVYDEINLGNSQAISRIEKLEWDAETLAEIIAQGRAYEADRDYIYAVKTSYSPVSISISNQYQANDHGLEMFTGTDVGLYAIILYGQDLKAKLTNDVVTWSAAQATEAQKKQARDNIGVTDLLNGAVLVESKVLVDNLSIAAGSFNESTYSVAKTGYKPIGVLGFNIGNGTSSGTGRSNAVFTKLYHYNGSVTACIKNVNANNAIKIKVTAYILYVKNGVFS